MPSNEIMSLEGQLCGIPLAGPESFSQQQLDYLKRALGVDETVLWSGDTGMIIGSSSGSCSLSESVFNFEKIGIYAQGSVVACIEPHCFEIGTSPMTFGLVVSQYESNETIFNDACVIGLTGSTLSYSNGSRTELKTSIAHRNDRGPKIVKIVGIHRIAGGN